MTRRVLVTGAAGFVGQHIVKRLRTLDWEVHGLSRKITNAGLLQGVHAFQGDLNNPQSFSKLPQQWDWVIHLAGNSVPSSFTSVDPIVDNLRTTFNLLNHLQSCRVLLASSCHVYSPSNLAHVEDEPLVPLGRYGLSKHLVEQLVPHFMHKLDIRIARPFNHLGPGQRQEMVVPSLIRRLHAKADNASELLMQGVDSLRDFVDVRDVASAYTDILNIDDPRYRVFNVCSGQPKRISEMIELALSVVGKQARVRFSETPNSSDDVLAIWGDPTRLFESSGWKPTHSLRESLEAMHQEALGA
jgi:GDP-4-dehydro-6-deoxy-D-mannose reductase